MSTDFAAPPAAPAQGPGAPAHCIAKRPDGVYADPAVLGPTLVAAADSIFRGGHYLAGIDYPAFLEVLFSQAGQPAAGAAAPVRIAADIRPFDPARRALYRAVKIGAGRAEYYFEPVWLPDPADPDGAGIPARLDIGEFIADMWLKGIRFGIDVAAVHAAVDSGKADRVTVARRLDPVPGQDARIEEVSDDIHRNDAPRQLANGKLDLHSFQNRFPQIQPGIRLLKKVPLTTGAPGFEMSGTALAAKPGRDLDFNDYAGEGTKVERHPDGEFLVSKQAGFLSVDAASSKISVGAKIVSRDGVSAKTTGNLQLTGDYEEFGEVQEKRVIEGEGITVHGDVFGELVSRGGRILLHANLIGGSARNKRGDIRVLGVASGAILVAENGAIVLERAENCVVSGTRITIAHAINCDVIGDEVHIGQSEGSAVAGRRVTVELALPRKQDESLIYVLRPEGAKLEEVMAAVGARLAQVEQLAARHKAQMEALTGQPDVRRYLTLASRLRKQEISFTPEQARQFQRMAQDVAPALKAIGDVSAKVKQSEADLEQGRKLMADLERQRHDAASVSLVEVRQVQGDTQVRVLGFSPAAGTPYIIAPREIKARLRGPQTGELLFSAAQGSFDWSSEPH